MKTVSIEISFHIESLIFFKIASRNRFFPIFGPSEGVVENLPQSPSKEGSLVRIVAQCSATLASVAAQPPCSATPFERQLYWQHPALSGGCRAIPLLFMKNCRESAAKRIARKIEAVWIAQLIPEAFFCETRHEKEATLFMEELTKIFAAKSERNCAIAPMQFFHGLRSLALIN